MPRSTEPEDAVASALAALANDPRILVPLADVREALGCPRARVEMLIGILTDRGLAEPSRRGRGGRVACVSLTPLAAARLGLRPDAESRQWIPAGSSDRQVRLPIRTEAREVDLSDPDRSGPGLLDSMPDPGAREPVALLIESEGAEWQGETIEPGPLPELVRLDRVMSAAQGPWKDWRRPDPAGAFLPKPTVLLGFDLPWNGPPPDGPCRGCGGPDVPHNGTWLCVRCHRYRYDERIPPTDTAAMVRAHRFRTDGLRGGLN